MSEFQPVVLNLPESFSPTLSVEILPRGLTLHRIIVQAGGKTHDIVIGPEAPEGHVHQKYTNTIVGRYANRIPVGTHSLERKGIQSKFEAQANESPKVSLHGGPTGYDSLPWAHVKSEDAVLFSSSELAHFSNDHATHAVFRLESADGDQGYPGKLLLEAIVALIAPEKPETPIGQNAVTPEYNLGSVFLAYRAKLDEGDKKVVTPVNLTQHWGFNLDASLREGATVADVKDHVLMVKSDRFAKLDGDALYAGFGHASDEKTHNHSAGKRIGDLFPEPRGYDDFYYLQNSTASDYPTRLALPSQREGVDLFKTLVKPLSGADRDGRPPPVVQLSSVKSGLGLTFDTNQHGVMFYSNGLASPERGARKKIHGGSGERDKGDAYGPATAVFLEFHEPLAAFLDPETKDGEDTLLTTDEIYNNYVRCDITFKDSVPVEA